MSATQTMPITEDTAAIFTRPQVEAVMRAARTNGAEHIHLAKDQGCLLGAPPAKAGHSPAHIVYAQGMDPNVVDFDEWWNRQRAVCGGDDFVERLDIGEIADLMKGNPKADILAFTFHEDAEGLYLQIHALP